MINTNSGHAHTCQHDTLDDEILIVSQNGSLSNTSLKFTYSYNDLRGLSAVVSEDERYYHTLTQNLLSDHPICTQLTAHISDRVKWP